MNVAVPLAEVFDGSVSVAVRLVEVDPSQPPPLPLPVPRPVPVPLVGVANVPLSVPTVTASPEATVVGKLDSDSFNVPGAGRIGRQQPDRHAADCHSECRAGSFAGDADV